MPRILRITPEMAGVPSAAPLARMPVTDAGWGVVAQATGQLAQTVQSTGNQLLRIQGALQAEDARLDMQEQFNKLKFDFAVRERDMRENLAMPEAGTVTASDMDGGVGEWRPPSPAALTAPDEEMAPGTGVMAQAAPATAPMSTLPALIQPAGPPATKPLPPKDYATAYAKELDKMVEDSVRGLKYPGYEREYRARLAPYIGAQKIEALNRGIKLQHEAMMLTDDMAARGEANTAVFGAPADQQAAFASRTNRLKSFVESGLMSGAGAAAKLQEFQSQVERGEVARDLQVPDRRPVVMDRLLSGQYKAIPPAEQIHMAQTYQDHYDAKARQAETEARRQFTEDREYITTDLFSRAVDKQLTKPELDEWARRWRLPRDAYEQILTELSREAREKASDQATLDRIEPDTHSISPRVTEQELLNLKSQGLLNRKDYIANLNRLRETQESLRSRGESIGMRRHAEAEQGLKEMLAIPPLYDKLDQNKERALKTFMPELRARSNMFDGKEDPIAVLESLRPRIEAFMGKDAALSTEQLAGVVGKHTTYQSLIAALRNKEITAAEFETKARAFRQMEKEAQESRLADLKAKIKANYDEALRLQGIKPPAGAPGATPNAGSPTGSRIK